MTQTFRKLMLPALLLVSFLSGAGCKSDGKTTPLVRQGVLDLAQRCRTTGS